MWLLGKKKVTSNDHFREALLAMQSAKSPNAKLRLNATLTDEMVASLEENLCSGNTPPRLTLDFSGTEQPAALVTTLSTALKHGKCPPYLCFNLRTTALTYDAVDALCEALESGAAPLHFSLLIGCNALNGEMVERIGTALESGKCPHSLRLDLAGCQLTDAKVLCDAIKSGNCPLFLRVNLSSNSLSEEEVSRLFSSLSCGEAPSHLSLLLSLNPLSDGAIETLSASLSSGLAPSNLSLYLSNCSLSETAMSSLFKALGSSNCPKFLNLNLGSNKVTEKSMQILCESLSSGEAPRYLSLGLGDCEICEDGIQLLSDALESGGCPEYLALDLSGAIFTQEGGVGVQPFCEALMSPQCPAHLKLSFTGGGMAGGFYDVLRDVLNSGKCPTYLTLDLSRDEISPKGINSICEALEGGSCPQYLKLDLSASFGEDIAESEFSNERPKQSKRSPPPSETSSSIAAVVCHPFVNRLCTALETGCCPTHLHIDLSTNQFRTGSVERLAECLETGKCPDHLTLDLSLVFLHPNTMGKLHSAFYHQNCPRFLHFIVEETHGGDSILACFEKAEKGQIPESFRLDFGHRGFRESSVPRFTALMANNVFSGTFGLNFAGTQFSDDAFGELMHMVGSGVCPSFFDLGLSGINLSLGKMRALSAALCTGRAPASISVDLSYNQMGEDMLGDLFDALGGGKCAEDVTVRLRGLELPGVVQRFAFLQGECPQKLSLDFANSRFADGNIDVICDAIERIAPTSTRTLHLCFDDTFLSKEAQRRIARCLSSLSSHEFNLKISLQNCNITAMESEKDDSAEARQQRWGFVDFIAEGIAKGGVPNSFELDLRHTMLSDISLGKLGRALLRQRKEGVKVLLSGEEQWVVFTELFKQARTSRLELQIGTAELNDTSLGVLLEGLASRRCPTHLMLTFRGNYFPEDYFERFIQCVEDGSCPSHLTLRFEGMFFPRNFQEKLFASISASSPQHLSIDLEGSHTKDWTWGLLQDCLEDLPPHFSLRVAEVVDADNVRGFTDMLASEACPAHLTLVCKVEVRPQITSFVCSTGDGDDDASGTVPSTPHPCCVVERLHALLRGEKHTERILGFSYPLASAASAEALYQIPNVTIRNDLDSHTTQRSAEGVLTDWRGTSYLSVAGLTVVPPESDPFSRVIGLCETAASILSTSDNTQKEGTLVSLVKLCTTDAPWPLVRRDVLAEVDETRAALTKAMEAVRENASEDTLQQSRDTLHAAHVTSLQDALAYIENEEAVETQKVHDVLTKLDGHQADDCFVDLPQGDPRDLAKECLSKLESTHRTNHAAQIKCAEIAQTCVDLWNVIGKTMHTGQFSKIAPLLSELETLGNSLDASMEKAATTEDDLQDAAPEEVQGIVACLQDQLRRLSALRGRGEHLGVVLKEQSARAEKQEIITTLNTLKMRLEAAEVDVDEAKLKARRAKQASNVTPAEQEAIDAGLTSSQKVLWVAQKALEKHERLTAMSAVRFYPELFNSSLAEVAKFGGLVCKRRLSDYTDIQFIAQGRHAVRKATKTDGTTCVLKHFAVTHRSGARRLLKEASALQRLKHPCIAEISCVFEDEGWHMEMPYYENGDLTTYIANHKLGADAKRQLLLDATRGLEYVHRNSLVHCDVKPDNVFVDSQGVGRLGDFDISRDLAPKAGMTTTMTILGGTARYMSPEVQFGNRSTQASDVYSLGLMIYDTVSKLPREDRVILKEQNISNPDALSLLKGMLSPHPEQRISAEAVSHHPYFRNLRGAESTLSVPVIWTNERAAGEVVDVTEEMLTPMQTIVSRTCEAGRLGRGRNNADCTHTSLQVVQVFRVEHTHLWEGYQLQRRQMLETCSSPEKITPLCHEESLSKVLSPAINEVHLFHGTGRRGAHAIVGQGMDDRVCRPGLYGVGLYFAENSSKSDEYMSPAREDGLCDLLLCRVLLGTPRHQASNRRPDERRAPCVEGHTNCTEHPQADSVLATRVNRPREFVIYERARVYPEYLLRIKRV